MNILCIYRAAEFSPNMCEKDAAIMDSVAEHLRAKGYTTTMVHEESLSSSDCHAKDCVLSMGRRTKTLEILSHLHVPVINSPASVTMAAHRNEVFEGDEPSDFPLWIKKAEGYSQCRDDVVYVEDERELNEAVAQFHDRGISNLFFSHHVEGDLVKFYGVRGTDFFSWNYYAGGFSKFGWEERNDKVYHYMFSVQELCSKADELALKTGLTVYGGDCIISEDGSVNIIDLNDWPSFGPCRDEAAEAISSLVKDSSEISIESTYKSGDTEEWLDVVFTRKIGFRFAKWFNRFDIHPNTVTVISMVLGALAGACFYFRADNSNGVLVNLLGVLLLMTANFLDSADGQLARMTGKMTHIGRILDGSAGEIWFICIYFALCMRLFWQPMPILGCQWGWWVFLVAAISGFLCHARQCNLADYYRSVHLFFLSGKPLDQFDTYENQRLLYQNIRWKDEPLWKFFMSFYVDYTKGQETQTPQFQKLMKMFRSSSDGISPRLREEFLRQSRPLMKWTNILTFNTRAIVLYVCCLTDIPWLYWTFEIIVMSALYFYMRSQHESMCRRISSNFPIV